MMAAKYVKRADLLLLFLYIAVSAAILLRAYADETGYTTPDSEYYLEAAENIREGKGFYMSNTYPIPVEKTAANQVYFTAWPVGYPLLIAAFSWVTLTSAFWASKLLNLLLMGMGFLLLRHINKAHSYLLAGAYCTYTLLAAYTYTWSEAPFDLGCLYFTYLLSQLAYRKRVNRTLLLLFLTCVFLFLVRYIGLFSFGVVALAAGYFWRCGERSISIKLLITAFTLCIVAASYFYINYGLTGSFSGGDRLAGGEPVGQFVEKQARGIINELFLVRKHYGAGFPDIVFWMVTVIQAVVIATIIGLLRQDRQNLYLAPTHRIFPKLCLFVAAFYFSLLLSLRAVSPFDPLDFRLLSPATFLTLVALLFYIAFLPRSHKHKGAIIAVIMAFSLFSLLLNLPKNFILQHLQQLFS